MILGENDNKGKYMLLEKMSYVNKDFKFPLTEQRDVDFYKSKLNEGYLHNDVFGKLVEHFSENKKLSGNVIKDQKFLYEFSILLEDDEFDPFGHLQLNDKIDEKDDCVLSFSTGNAKIKHPFFSLPAGYTCPFADICQSFVQRDRSDFKSTGKKIMDKGDIRCYAASAELAYPNVQNSRWKNFDLINEFKGDTKGMTELLKRSFQNFGKNFSVFRIHESGDFFSQEYFDAWLDYIKTEPNILFYAYTKALPYWVARLNQIPPNFKLNASKGGKYDELIDKYNLKQAVIVKSPEEAKQLKLPIDVDDTLAYKSDRDFALLLHGVQSKESGLNKYSRENQKTLKNIKSKMR